MSASSPCSHLHAWAHCPTPTAFRPGKRYMEASWQRQLSWFQDIHDVVSAALLLTLSPNSTQPSPHRPGVSWLLLTPGTRISRACQIQGPFPIPASCLCLAPSFPSRLPLALLVLILDLWLTASQSCIAQVWSCH